MQAEKRLSAHMGPVGAWAFAVGTSVGWGSLVVTSNTYLVQAGPVGSVLGILAGAFVMLIISRNYAYMINCFPEAGGAYTYTREVFGYDQGFLTAWFLGLVYLAILWANASSLPVFARYFIGDIFQKGQMYSLFGYDVYIGEVLLCIAAVSVIALLCIFQVGIIMKIMITLACVFTAGIIIVFIGAATGSGQSFTPAFVPESSALSQIIRIAVISPWAFIGFESISHGAEEYSFRKTSIFPVFAVSVATATLLYILITLLSVTAYPERYVSWLEYIQDLENLNGIEGLPAFYAAYHYMGSKGLVILMLCLLSLIISSLIGNIMALSRLVYTLGKDRILPEQFAQLSRKGAPAKATLLVLCMTVIVMFLGRVTIGWIVDITTIGATIIYGLVSFTVLKLARSRGDITEIRTGAAGLIVMVIFGLCLLLPNLISKGSMAKESYFLFLVWSVLGFIYFSTILHRDKAGRFGKSVVVWIALLSLVLFISLIWMRQAMIYSNIQMVQNIQEYYVQSGVPEVRAADEQFMERQIAELQAEDTQTILVAMGMFAFALAVMMMNYSYMNRRARESERIASTDTMTGVKNKHAYIMAERDLDARIGEGLAEDFAVVVCDVNGLKHINDTYGHKAGDEYLRAACSLICKLFQHSPVFRTGGDEFVVILTGSDYADRNSIMDRLQKNAEAGIGTDTVTVASGISEFIRESDPNVHEVFERADALMYRNKNDLKNKGAHTR